MAQHVPKVPFAVEEKLKLSRAQRVKDTIVHLVRLNETLGLPHTLHHHGALILLVLAR